MKENNMIIMGHGGASYYAGLFNKDKRLTEYKVTDITYRGGIKINDKTILITGYYFDTYNWYPINVVEGFTKEIGDYFKNDL